MIDLLIFVTVFLFFGQLVVYFFVKANKYKKNREVFTLALLLRIFLTWFYYYRTLTFGGDAMMYYTYAQEKGLINLPDIFNVNATEFTSILASIFYQPVSLFPNSYLMLYIPFSLLGFIGSLLLYRILNSLMVSKPKLNSLLAFFLPNIIFWTCNIGKDSIIYFAIVSMISVIILNKNKKFELRSLLNIVVSGALIYFIRPHILIVLVLGLILGSLFAKNNFSIRNIVIFLTLFFILISVSGKMLSIINIKVDSEEDIPSYYEESVEQIERRASYYEEREYSMKREGPLSIPLAPIYGVIWLCIPFFWQAQHFNHIFGVFDGFVYQYFLLYIFIHWRAVIRNKILPYKYGWVVYVMIISSLFGMFQLNFGLAVRQKIMVAPVVIILFAIVKYNTSNKKSIKTDLTEKNYYE